MCSDSRAAYYCLFGNVRKSSLLFYHLQKEKCAVFFSMVSKSNRMAGLGYNRSGFQINSPYSLVTTESRGESKSGLIKVFDRPLKKGSVEKEGIHYDGGNQLLLQSAFSCDIAVYAQGFLSLRKFSPANCTLAQYISFFTSGVS